MVLIWAHRVRHSTQISRNEHASWDVRRNLHRHQKWARELRHSTQISRNEHASWDIRRKLHPQQKWARELRHSTQINRNEHASWDIRRNLHLQGQEGGNPREGGPLETILKTNKMLLITSFFGRLEAGGYFRQQKWAEMSTRAETFDKNQQNWARELRHSTKVKGEESTSAAGMSTRAETFDTNQQKWARELRHSKESTSAGAGGRKSKRGRAARNHIKNQ